MQADVTIFTDGGARGNPGPAAIGIVAFNSANEEVYRHGECLGAKTNNEAEYGAFLQSLKWIDTYVKNTNVKSVEWKLDSLLVVEQLNKHWKIKEARLQQFAQAIWQELGKHSFSYTITHVPRAQNAIADSLVNKALDEATSIN